MAMNFKGAFDQMFAEGKGRGRLTFTEAIEQAGRENRLDDILRLTDEADRLFLRHIKKYDALNEQDTAELAKKRRLVTVEESMLALDESIAHSEVTRMARYPSYEALKLDYWNTLVAWADRKGYSPSC